MIAKVGGSWVGGMWLTAALFGLSSRSPAVEMSISSEDLEKGQTYALLGGLRGVSGFGAGLGRLRSCKDSQSVS